MSCTVKEPGKNGRPKVSNFEKLEDHVAREYEEKGMKPKAAKAIGVKVAGKVKAEKGE